MCSLKWLVISSDAGSSVYQHGAHVVRDDRLDDLGRLAPEGSRGRGPARPARRSDRPRARSRTRSWDGLYVRAGASANTSVPGMDRRRRAERSFGVDDSRSANPGGAGHAARGRVRAARPRGCRDAVRRRRGALDARRPGGPRGRGDRRRARRARGRASAPTSRHAARAAGRATRRWSSRTPASTSLRRGGDGTWRAAISLLDLDTTTERRTP